MLRYVKILCFYNYLIFWFDRKTSITSLESLENLSPFFLIGKSIIIFEYVNIVIILSLTTGHTMFVHWKLQAPQYTSKSCLFHHDWLQKSCGAILFIILLVRTHLNSDLSWAQRNFPLSAEECENCFLVSNSVTVKLKHPSWKNRVEADFIVCPQIKELLLSLH